MKNVAFLAFGLALGSASAAWAYMTVAPTVATQMQIGTIASPPVTCGGSTKGYFYMATDLLTPVALATAVGGGAVSLPVSCDGTNWKVG